MTAEPETGGTVRVEKHGAISEIALAGGPLNLVTRALLRALDRVLAALERDDGLRCVILHGGEARAFCAGSDINAFAGLREEASERKILFEDMVLRRLARLPVPTIAAIDGPALGGGFELALACDLRVLRDGVEVGLPECRLGGLAGSGAVRLTRLVGPSRAKEMLFGGAMVASDRALAWGLVNRVVASSALAVARSWAGEIARRGPLSNRLAKGLVDEAQDVALDAALASATVAQRTIFDSDDLHEGAAAFLAKREARFDGR